MYTYIYIYIYIYIAHPYPRPFRGRKDGRKALCAARGRGGRIGKVDEAERCVAVGERARPDLLAFGDLGPVPKRIQEGGVRG